MHSRCSAALAWRTVCPLPRTRSTAAGGKPLACAAWGAWLLSGVRDSILGRSGVSAAAAGLAGLRFSLFSKLSPRLAKGPGEGAPGCLLAERLLRLRASSSPMGDYASLWCSTIVGSVPCQLQVRHDINAQSAANSCSWFIPRNRPTLALPLL